MKKFNFKKYYSAKIVSIVFVSVFIFSFIFFHGFPGIKILAPKEASAAIPTVVLNSVTDMGKWVWEKGEKIADFAFDKAGAKIFNAAIRKAINTIAYESAVYLATGAEGQKPTWYGEGFGDFLGNVADNAAGEFIEQLGREWDFNLCEPNLDLKLNIGLGLVKQKKPTEPECTFSEMVNSWESEIDQWSDMASDDYLARLQNVFDPTANDLAVTLSLFEGMKHTEDLKKEAAEKDRVETEGWLDLRGIDMVRDTFPKQTEQEAERASENWIPDIQTTGNILIDAANIFLNQYAVTLITAKLRNLGGESVTSPYDFSSLSLEGAVVRTGGTSIVQKNLKKIVDSEVFSVQSDYDVLSSLTSCPNPEKAGPDNCVINDKFRQAIAEKMTVREAMEQEYLNPNAVVGFMSDGFEPKYDEGYPYRSLIILRKFRIIPVGWELAAEHIKNDPTVIERTLKQLVDCYYSGSWCRGLIDPTWVLKAPVHYCQRQGYGAEINSIQVTGEKEDSELRITRADDYCADSQSCINENDDGTCNYYGYCLEEKRKWNFSSTSCEPEYNTCQAFINEESGRNNSFLENTLKYCSSDAAGCKAYCTAYDYDDQIFTCLPTEDDDKMYFNNNIEECEVEAEGCHEFIRTKAGLGANLLINSSFEDGMAMWTARPFGSGIVAASSEQRYMGEKSLKITFDGTSGEASWAVQQIYGFTGQERVTVSYYVWTEYAENGPDGAWLAVEAFDEFDRLIESIPSSIIENTWEGGGTWKKIAFSFITPDYTTQLRISPRVTEVAAMAYFDGIKVEKGGQATGYTDYRGTGLVYQKLIPEYLEDVCYDNNYLLKDDAPAECENYIRYCDEDEAGCEMYTSQTTLQSIPAKVLPSDYCEAECVGYNTYIQNESIFDSKRAEYFIPKTARTCVAESVGCDEFTNLDEAELGGETREYYKYLRQCSLPSDTSCADFYTWEGNEETGYQLKNFRLKVDRNDVDQNGLVSDPYLTNVGTYEGRECNSFDDYNPVINPDCREFYDMQGNKHYKFYHYTVTCSDDCHPYRRTEKNIDYDLGDSAACSVIGSGLAGVEDEQFYWDSVNEVCYFCKNGGAWDEQQQACIYMSIPREGEICSASQNGCREYSGSTGGNYQIVASWNFDNNSTEGWGGISGTNVNLSSESITTAGQSLSVSGGILEISISLGNLLNDSSAYNLDFLAKSPAAANIEICLRNTDSNTEPEVCFNRYQGSEILSTILITPEWAQHSAHIDLKDYYLQHEISASEELVIRCVDSEPFFIDNIRLTEVIDRYYLIKNSWRTPDACNENIYGEYVPWHDLGCDYYKDRDNKSHYLHNFSELCQESGVGCEIMIDTHNYTSYLGYNWANGSFSVSVPADNVVYAVYNKDKSCKASDKGCQLFGSVYSYLDEELYSSVYYLNNPDNYNRFLCSPDDVGCETWAMDCSSVEKGACADNVVFKNPGDTTCEFRMGSLDNKEMWYKTKVKRCAVDSGAGGICQNYNNCPVSNTPTCSNDGDCPDGSSCYHEKCYYSCEINEDEDDELCPSFTTLSTFGYGGSPVYQPSSIGGNNWVGLCPAKAAGCSEYIEPISSFSENLLSSGGSVALNPSTLYALEGSISGSGLYTLDSNNNLVPGIGALTYTTGSGGTASGNSVKKVIVDYRLRQEVDRVSCPSGQANLEGGCVLFNERTQAGNNTKKDLIFDANSATYYRPTAGTEDSNVVLKVEPDRVCSEWLACKSYILDKRTGEGNNYMELGEKAICFDRSACDRLDDQGRCENFVSYPKTNLTYSSSSATFDITNLTGYSKVGYGISSLNKDYYPVSAMEQIGGAINFNAGGFESYSDEGYPLGWESVDNMTNQRMTVWDPGMFKVISSPYEAKEKEGINYPEGGVVFLKYSPARGGILSTFIKVEPGSSYGLSALLNTKNLFIESGEVSAVVRIYEFDANNSLVGSSNQISLPAGQSWTKLTKRVTLGSATEKIKIGITTNLEAGKISGAIYADSITLSAALEYRSDDVATESCRLYPQEDSLACEYINDAGITTKGWYGYCLEYDRYPGSEGTCLMWYPVDRIRGDGIEENAGYQGRNSVYYCEKAEYFIPVEYRFPFWLHRGGSCEVDDCLKHFGYDYFGVCYDASGSNENTFCIPKADYILKKTPLALSVNSGERSFVPKAHDDLHHVQDYLNGIKIAFNNFGPYNYNEGEGWYKFNGFVGKSSKNAGELTEGQGTDYYEQDLGIKYYDPMTGYIYDSIFGNCLVVANVVDSIGQNNYWQARVFDGSSYMSPPSGADWTAYQMSHTFYDGLNYNAYQYPYGSIPEATVGDISSWSGTAPDFITQPESLIYPHQSVFGLDQKFTANVPWPLPLRVGVVQKSISENFGISSIANTNSVLSPAGFPHYFEYPDRYTTGANTDGCGDTGIGVYSRINLGECSKNGRPCLIGKYCKDVDEDNEYGTTPTPDQVHDDTIVSIPRHLNLADCGENEGSCRLITQASSGSESIKRLFAQSYGHWEWSWDFSGDGDAISWTSVTGAEGEDFGYVALSGAEWLPPTTPCGSTRPAYPNDYCGVSPRIFNIAVDKNNLPGGGYVNLTFNTQVDPQQSPLVMYTINWGDDSSTVISGVQMRARPSTDNPHSAYHLYSCSEASCNATPSIEIEDNWGWPASASGPVITYSR